MNKVLLDKDAGSNKLRNACNEQGIVQCYLLPVTMRDTATDCDVAEFAIKSGDFMVTFDRGFCSEAGPVLAGRSPGLLLLRADDDSAKRISRKMATELLSSVKRQFPEWFQVPWQNSFVELTPTLAFVYHTLNYEPVFLELLDRRETAWQDKLKQHLAANASGSPRQVVRPSSLALPRE